jgi:hypothetical protein
MKVLRILLLAVSTLSGSFLTGCATPAQTVGLAVGTTVAGAHSPSQEIEQVYYLGVFDPLEQVPPSVYRVTVHGQASIMSLAKFATGWVPADMVDSLNSKIGYDENGKIELTRMEGDQKFSLNARRRMVLFGPEGFREAPRNHRLVIVMGTNPSRYFEAVKDALSETIEGQGAKQDDKVITELLRALLATGDERRRFEEFQNSLKKSEQGGN